MTQSAESDAANAERDQFCEDLGVHLADALESLGVEDADMSDGRMLADVVYCLGYRVFPPGLERTS